MPGIVGSDSHQQGDGVGIATGNQTCSYSSTLSSVNIHSHERDDIDEIPDQNILWMSISAPLFMITPVPLGSEFTIHADENAIGSLPFPPSKPVSLMIN